MSNLGGILAKELFKFLLTEVFKTVNICTMILCTVKNTVDYTGLKKSYPLKSINHERWDLMDLWAELYCKFDVLSRPVFTVCFSNVEYTHKSLKPHRSWFILKRQRFFQSR